MTINNIERTKEYIIIETVILGSNTPSPPMKKVISLQIEIFKNDKINKTTK